MGLKSKTGRFLNRILKGFGLRISKAVYTPDILTDSRVTVKGMEKAITRAETLFPDRKTAVLIDRDTDAAGIRFDQKLKIECRKISGSAEKDLADFDISGTSFVFGFNSDEQASSYLGYVAEKDGKYFCSYDIQNARWWHIRDIAETVLLAEGKDCKENNYSHFAPDQLANIMQAIDITRSIPGDYVEIGVFRGTSARLAYHYMKATRLKRNCYFLDTFAGFEYEAAKKSSDAHWQGTHDVSMELVRKRMEAAPSYDGPQPEFNLVKSDIIQDELSGKIKSIAMCNIDVDMYEAVLVALEKTWPLLARGGICIVQDPGRTPLLGGARLALDQFLVKIKNQKCLAVYLESGQTYLFKC